MFYPPLLVYVVILMIGHRSLTGVHRGQPGHSRRWIHWRVQVREILAVSSRTPDRVARAALLPEDAPTHRRAAIARAFMEHAGLSLPIVVKPDQGQRGTGVAIVRSDADLDVRLASLRGDVIVL